MTDDGRERLRAAAKQAIWQWDNHDRYRTFEVGPDMVANERGYAEPLTVALARAYLALLGPADDGEPVTEEWLKEIGFYCDPTRMRWMVTILAYGPGRIYVTPIPKTESKDWPWAIWERGLGGQLFTLPNQSTRGAVRRLLAALSPEVPR